MPLAAFPKCFIKAIIVEKTMTLDDWVNQAAEQLDIDGLEFYSELTPLTDGKELKRLRMLMESHDLAMPMMCVSPDFTKASAAERDAEVEKHKLAIDATVALGGKFCRVLSGQKRPGLARAAGIRMVADCIIKLIPYAQKRGIVLNLENHYKDGFWQYPEFAQKIDVFIDLLAAIPESASFGVNFDPSNTIIAGEDPVALLEQVKRRVVTMHASDRYFEGGTAEDLRRIEANPQTGYSSILKHGVIGKGLNDYDKIFSILKGVGFSGWISIEDGEDPVVGMEHLRLSADFLREKMLKHGLK
jgi:sugar phosphate isomerase/epimerase